MGSSSESVPQNAQSEERSLEPPNPSSLSTSPATEQRQPDESGSSSISSPTPEQHTEPSKPGSSLIPVSFLEEDSQPRGTEATSQNFWQAFNKRKPLKTVDIPGLWPAGFSPQNSSSVASQAPQQSSEQRPGGSEGKSDMTVAEGLQKTETDGEHSCRTTGASKVEDTVNHPSVENNAVVEGPTAVEHTGILPSSESQSMGSFSGTEKHDDVTPNSSSKAPELRHGGLKPQNIPVLKSTGAHRIAPQSSLSKPEAAARPALHTSLAGPTSGITQRDLLRVPNSDPTSVGHFFRPWSANQGPDASLWGGQGRYSRSSDADTSSIQQSSRGTDGAGSSDEEHRSDGDDDARCRTPTAGDFALTPVESCRTSFASESWGSMQGAFEPGEDGDEGVIGQTGAALGSEMPSWENDGPRPSRSSSVYFQGDDASRSEPDAGREEDAYESDPPLSYSDPPPSLVSNDAASEIPREGRSKASTPTPSDFPWPPTPSTHEHSQEDGVADAVAAPRGRSRERKPLYDVEYTNSTRPVYVQRRASHSLAQDIPQRGSTRAAEKWWDNYHESFYATPSSSIKGPDLAQFTTNWASKTSPYDGAKQHAPRSVSERKHVDEKKRVRPSKEVTRPDHIVRSVQFQDELKAGPSRETKSACQLSRRQTVLSRGGQHKSRVHGTQARSSCDNVQDENEFGGDSGVGLSPSHGKAKYSLYPSPTATPHLSSGTTFAATTRHPSPPSPVFPPLQLPPMGYEDLYADPASKSPRQVSSPLVRRASSNILRPVSNPLVRRVKSLRNLANTRSQEATVGSPSVSANPPSAIVITVQSSVMNEDLAFDNWLDNPRRAPPIPVRRASAPSILARRRSARRSSAPGIAALFNPGPAVPALPIEAIAVTVEHSSSSGPESNQHSSEPYEDDFYPHGPAPPIPPRARPYGWENKKKAKASFYQQLKSKLPMSSVFGSLSRNAARDRDDSAVAVERKVPQPEVEGLIFQTEGLQQAVDDACGECALRVRREEKGKGKQKAVAQANEEHQLHENHVLQHVEEVQPRNLALPEAGPSNTPLPKAEDGYPSTIRIAPQQPTDRSTLSTKIQGGHGFQPVCTPSSMLAELAGPRMKQIEAVQGVSAAKAVVIQLKEENSDVEKGPLDPVDAYMATMMKVWTQLGVPIRQESPAPGKLEPKGSVPVKDSMQIESEVNVQVNALGKVEPKGTVQDLGRPKPEVIVQAGPQTQVELDRKYTAEVKRKSSMKLPNQSTSEQQHLSAIEALAQEEREAFRSRPKVAFDLSPQDEPKKKSPKSPFSNEDGDRKDSCEVTASVPGLRRQVSGFSAHGWSSGSPSRRESTGSSGDPRNSLRQTETIPKEIQDKEVETETQNETRCCNLDHAVQQASQPASQDRCPETVPLPAMSTADNAFDEPPARGSPASPEDAIVGESSTQSFSPAREAIPQEEICPADLNYHQGPVRYPKFTTMIQE